MRGSRSSIASPGGVQATPPPRPPAAESPLRPEDVVPLHAAFAYGGAGSDQVLLPTVPAFNDPFSVEKQSPGLESSPVVAPVVAELDAGVRDLSLGGSPLVCLLILTILSV